MTFIPVRFARPWKRQLTLGVAHPQPRVNGRIEESYFVLLRNPSRHPEANWAATAPSAPTIIPGSTAAKGVVSTWVGEIATPTRIHRSVMPFPSTMGEPFNCKMVG